MRSLGRRACLAMLFAAVACHRTDPGGQCSSLAQCAAGSYCQAGYCQSDCASSGDCALGSFCTPQGQCVQQDQLYCEEGPDQAPAQYAKALGLANPFMLEDLVDCTALSINNPEVLPGVLASGELMFSSCTEESNLQEAAGLLQVGELGACRPALIEPDRVLWHALPIGLSYVFNSPDTVDTVMEARTSGDSVQYVIGAPLYGTLSDPMPGHIWASGSGSLDGTRLQALYQSAALQAETLHYAPDAGDIGGPGAVQGVRTVLPDGGVEADVRVQSLVSSEFQTDQAAQLMREGDHVSARFLDPLDGGLRFELQLTPSYAGRYDDALDGGQHSICWNISADGGENVTYARDVDQAYGDESSCLFTRGTP